MLLITPPATIKLLMSLKFPFKIKFTNKQIEKLADITADIGQAFLITSFIPFLLGLAHIPIIVVSLTLIDSVGFWVIAISIAGLSGGKK